MIGRWRSATAGPTRRARVTDIAFDDAVADPIGQVARVYDAVGLPLTVEAEGAMPTLAGRASPRGGAPAVRTGDYGLRPEQVDERFTLYNKRFRQRCLRVRTVMVEDPVATASQHEQELAALELIEHPTVKAAYQNCRGERGWAAPRRPTRCGSGSTTRSPR